MKHRWAALVMVGVVGAFGAVAACGGGNDSGPLIPGTACVPGQQIACTCPGGGVGAQACTADGDGYGACTGCGAVGPGSGGGDATVSNDGAGPSRPPPGDDDSGQVSSGDDDDSGQGNHGNDANAPGDDSGGITGLDSGTHDSGEPHDSGAHDASKPHDAGEDATTPKDSGSNPPPVNAGPCDPAAYDFTGKCGTTAPCDQSLAANGSASDFAKAIGICPTSVDATHWGLVSAAYSAGHSAQDAGAGNFDQQHGILSTFGTVLLPREGSMLGVLSSGSATATDSDDGPFFKGGKNGMQGVGGVLGTTGNSGDLPAGYPVTYPGCPALSTILDDIIDVRLQVRVPINAYGFALELNFMSGDWPDYVCSQFNDGFIAYLSSGAFNGGTPANMALDATGNPITINSPSLPVCTPGVTLACNSSSTPIATTSTCASGPTSLTGTGYVEEDDAGAWCGSVVSTTGGGTNWLTAEAPVEPGEVITLELIIWDSGDASYDSSVLLDHFHWLQTAPAVVKENVTKDVTPRDRARTPAPRRSSPR